MPSAKLYVVMATLVVAGGGLAYWRFHAGRQAPASDSPLATNDSDLRRQLKELRERQTRLENSLRTSRQPTPSQADDPGSIEGASVTPKGKVRERLTPEQAEARREARYQVLEHQVTTERVDPRWASATESGIREHLTAMPGVKIEDLRCASTMCRMTVSYESEQAGQGFPSAFPWASVGVQRGTAKNIDVNGVRKTLVYAMREGSDLPPL